MEITFSCKLGDIILSNEDHGMHRILAASMKAHEIYGYAFFWGMQKPRVKHACFATLKVLGGIALSCHGK